MFYKWSHTYHVHIKISEKNQIFSKMFNSLIWKSYHDTCTDLIAGVS